MREGGLVGVFVAPLGGLLFVEFPWTLQLLPLSMLRALGIILRVGRLGGAVGRLTSSALVT